MIVNEIERGHRGDSDYKSAEFSAIGGKYRRP